MTRRPRTFAGAKDAVEEAQLHLAGAVALYRELSPRAAETRQLAEALAAVTAWRIAYDPAATWDPPSFEVVARLTYDPDTDTLTPQPERNDP
jgi:hypothetical protein